MDTTTPGMEKKEDRKRVPVEKAQSAFEALNASELMWQPYRSMSRVLLQTHQNLAAYIDVNRSLADEMQAILRRAQDMVLEMSDKAFRRMGDPAEDRSPSMSQMEDMYDFAIESVRELGDATVAAHIRSLEALRDHARGAMKAAAAEKVAKA